MDQRIGCGDFLFLNQRYSTGLLRLHPLHSTQPNTHIAHFAGVIYPLLLKNRCGGTTADCEEAARGGGGAARPLLMGDEATGGDTGEIPDGPGAGATTALPRVDLGPC